MTFIVALGQLAINVFIVVYIVRSVLRLRRGVDPAADPDWYKHAFNSLDDLLSQLLIGVALTLGVVGLIALSRRVGLPVIPEVYLAVGIAAGFALSWRTRAPALFVLAILGLYGWWGSIAWRWVQAADAGGVTVPIGFALLAIALMAVGRLFDGSGRGRRFGFFAWLFGLFGLVIFLFWASSQEGVAMLGELRHGSPFVASVPLALLTGSVLALSAAGVVFAVVRRSMSLAEAGYLGATWLSIAVVAILPPSETAVSSVDFFMPGSPQLTASGTAWAVAYNLLLLAGLLGLVFLGYLRQEDWLVNFGAVLLFVFVLFKYFDWLFTFLDRSVAFIVAGLLFLAVGAAMERGRRFVLSAMEPENG